MNLLTLYFSGTGNTRYIAKLFAKSMAAAHHSIEDAINFNDEIARHDTIALCYPIYGSRAPLAMRQFITRHKQALAGKKLIILVTQTFFSGDGARSLMDLLPTNHATVIYAEHFSMPNNVSNIFFLRPISERKKKNYVRRAKIKMATVCRDIKEGNIKRRGFNAFSELIGKVQGIPWQGSSRKCAAPKHSMEYRAKNSVNISAGCTQCGICVACCPMSNFASVNGTIVPQDNCTVCYRCINRCPQKAISVWFTQRPKWQYRGPK